MIHTFLAHAGEVHTTEIEASAHFLQEWYIVLPLFMLIVALLGTLIYFLTKRSKPATYLGVTSILLIAGVGTYAISPVISITALGGGLALLLVIVLASLLKPPAKKPKRT